MNSLIIASLLQISDEVADIIYIANDDFYSNPLKACFIFFTVFQFVICLFITSKKYFRINKNSLQLFEKVKNNFMKNSTYVTFILFPFVIIAYLACAMILLFQILWRAIIIWLRLDKLMIQCSLTRKFLDSVFLENIDDIPTFIAQNHQYQSLEIILEVNSTCKDEWTWFDILGCMFTAIDFIYYSMEILVFMKDDVRIIYNKEMKENSKYVLCPFKFALKKLPDNNMYIRTFKERKTLGSIVLLFLIIQTIFQFSLSVTNFEQLQSLKNQDYRIAFLDEDYQQSFIDEFQKKKNCTNEQEKVIYSQKFLKCELFTIKSSEYSDEFISYYSYDTSAKFSDVHVDKDDDFNKAIQSCKKDDDKEPMKECLDKNILYKLEKPTDDLTYFLMIIWRDQVSKWTNDETNQQTEEAIERFYQRLRYSEIKSEVRRYIDIQLAQSILYFLILIPQIYYIKLQFDNDNADRTDDFQKCVGIYIFNNSLFILMEIIGFSLSKHQVDELQDKIEARYSDSIFVFYFLIIILIFALIVYIFKFPKTNTQDNNDQNSIQTNLQVHPLGNVQTNVLANSQTNSQADPEVHKLADSKANSQSSEANSQNSEANTKSQANFQISQTNYFPQSKVRSQRKKFQS